MHRAPGRERSRRRARSRVLTVAAVPVALGLMLGAVIASSPSADPPSRQAASTVDSPATTAPSPSDAASSPADASPSDAASSPADAAPAPSASVPAPDAAAAAPAAANVSCDIIVPANPLSAQGLATPYQLTGPRGASPAASGCTMANFANLGAYVQATILDPATGALSVYAPLVTTKGVTPAVPPVAPVLPAGAVVTIDFGFNGTNLTQVPAAPGALLQGRCINGLFGSVFGQVSFCNGIAFFAAARQAVAAGTLKVPALGTSAANGMACPSTRSFDLVDQDQSDNVTSTYLLNADGTTAQFSAANAAVFPAAKKINNGSDNFLLDSFVDPALGCAPFQAPDQSQGGAMAPSQALNELSAAAGQAAPVALVPQNDPMAMVGNNLSAFKTDLYRVNVGQPIVSNATNQADSPANYCRNLANIAPAFLMASAVPFNNAPSPVAGTNLEQFLQNRLAASFVNLKCANFGVNNPMAATP